MQLAQQQRLTLPVQAGATVAASRRQRLPRSWQPAPAAAAAPYAGPHSSSPWSPQAQAQARQSLRRGRSTRPASAVEQQAETAERAAEQPTAAAPAEEQAQQRQGVAFTTTTVGDDTRMSKAERATLYKLSKPVSEFGFSRCAGDCTHLLVFRAVGRSAMLPALRTCARSHQPPPIRTMPQSDAGCLRRSMSWGRRLARAPRARSTPPRAARRARSEWRSVPRARASCGGGLRLHMACSPGRDHRGGSCTTSQRITLALALAGRVAVKVMPKRVGPDGFLERTFARRVLNEVEIATHLGQRCGGCVCQGCSLSGC